ncbi:MAG: hypothetical protein HY868_25575 [Chloroflexi bacterium]|nr:hypothetical protein [Chloroflexota bacterium]
MGLNEQIAAYLNRPSFRVFVSGAPFYLATQISIAGSFDQQIAEARIAIPSEVVLDPSMTYPVEIYQGYNGFEERTFYGFIEDVEVARVPDTWELVCSDALMKARETWLDEVGVSFSMTQAEDAVRQLLGMAGLSVNARASNFSIGDTHPSEFKLCSVLDAANQIAALIGWAIWATTDGTIIFDYRKPLPGTNHFWTYREASSPAATDGNIIGKFRHTKTQRHLRNRTIILGYGKIRAEAKAGSAYVPSPPTYRTAILSSELVDTQGMANAMAPWMLNDLNHLWESAEFTIPGNPRLRIGHTLKLIESKSRQNANYFLFGYTSQMDASGGYTMDLEVVGGNSSPFTYDGGEEQKPVASFDYEQVVWGDPMPVLYVDASSSYSPDATITLYSWDWGDGTPDESSASPYAHHKYDYALYMTPVTVTLTITDSLGQTATCSKTIVIGDVGDEGFAYATLYAGGDANVYVTLDSGLTKTTIPISSAVNHIAANVRKTKGTVLVGCVDGSLYKVTSTGTSVILKRTFGASVRSCYVDHNDDGHWLVGLGNGELWETKDKGVEWTLIHTFEHGIRRYAFINPQDAMEWWAPTAGELNHSIDGGLTWENKLVNWANGTFNFVVGLAWHFMQHLVVAVNGGTNPLGYSGDSGGSFVGGGNPTFSHSAITGGILSPTEFAASSTDTAYVFVTNDGAVWTPSENFVTLLGARDVLYHWRLRGTLAAGG